MRTKRALRWNKKAFFIILKELSIAKNCLSPESAPLIYWFKLRDKLLIFSRGFIAKISKQNIYNVLPKIEWWVQYLQKHVNPVDTGRKLNVHKTLRRCPGRLLNVLCTFKLRPVSTGKHVKTISRRPISAFS